MPLGVAFADLVLAFLWAMVGEDAGATLRFVLVSQAENSPTATSRRKFKKGVGQKKAIDAGERPALHSAGTPG